MPFDAVADYDDYVDGKPRGRRRALASSQSRGIELPDGDRDDPPDAETIHGLGDRKNEIVLRLIHDGRRAGLRRARSATCEAARAAGLRARRGVLERQLPGRARSPPGSPTCSRRGSTATSPTREHLQGKPAPDTFLAGARGARRRARRRPPCSRTRSPGVEAGRAGQLRLRRRRRPRRAGRRAARARRRRRRRRTSPSCSTRRGDRSQSRLPGRALGLRETALDLDLLAQTRVGVRAVQRPHRPARQPRRGRAVRAPGHLPQRLLRAAPAALRRGRRTATRSRARRVVNVTNGKIIRLLVDDEPLRRPLRRAATPTSACSTCAPASLHRTVGVGVSGRARRCGSRSMRLVSFTQRAVAAISYEVEPLDGRCRVVVQSELVANEPTPERRRRPARAAALDGAAASRGITTADDTRARSCVTPTRRERPAGGRRDGPRDRRPAADTEIDRGLRRPRPADRDRRPRRRASRCALVKFIAYGWSARALACRRVRDQVGGRARGGRSTPAGTGCSPSSGHTSTTSGSGADVEVDGDAELQQAVRFALFHVLQAARARRAAGDPGQGPDRPRLRRARVLGHRDVRAAGADLHRARTPPRMRCAGVTRRSTLARERAAPARAQRRGLPVAHDRTARSARATGRPAPPRSTSTPTSPTPSSATQTRTGDEAVRARRRRSSCSSRPRGCGARSATTTPAGRFRIDGVTGPDEYSAVADNNVYTNLMAAAEPARGRRRGRAAPGRRRRPRGRRRGGGELARRRPTDGRSRTTRDWGSIRRPRASPITTAGTSPRPRPSQYPLLLHFPYFDLYRKQVVKQADLVLAMFALRRRLHRRAEGRATSPTTRR